MNNLLHHTTALKSRSKGLRFDLESPMESSASADQLSPRTRQRERIKTVRNIGIRTIASIIVLGLLCVGSIQNLDWHIDGIKQKHDEQEQTEKALYTQPVEKIVLLGERHSGTNWITNHLTECFHGDHLKVCETCKIFSFIVIKVYYSLARCTLNGRLQIYTQIGTSQLCVHQNA